MLVDLGRRFVEHRILGLAAEIAFFALLSLPPLVFGLTGAIGFVADRYDPGVVHAFRDGLVVVAGNFLTANVLDTVVTPTLDSVLAEGRIDVISIGFLIALWAGSRTMVVLMDTIAIMYGKAGHRSILSSWAASFGIYVLLILVCALVVPAMLIGPGLVGLSTTSDLLGQVVFWSAVLAGGVTLLTGVFHACLPRRRAWARDLPGAVLTVVIWYGGSWLLEIRPGGQLQLPHPLRATRGSDRRADLALSDRVGGVGRSGLQRLAGGRALARRRSGRTRAGTRAGRPPAGDQARTSGHRELDLRADLRRTSHIMDACLTYRNLDLQTSSSDESLWVY
ncbi:MAG: YihY/virulence factor BrkB family protein [Micropruina sp.]|nr:YihY/virulence factor BrkB family protein [Micropruina sp.]